MKTFLLLLTLSTATLAQQPPSTVPAQLDAMKKCSFLEGQWHGNGWMMFGPNDRRTFNRTEDVKSKLNGLVLQIDGLGKDSTGKAVHQALAILSYDPGSSAYHFRSYEALGHYADADAECHDNKMIWSMQAGPRKMRYTITLNEKGQWHEIGETSADGNSWQKFFEMTLDKAK